MAHKKVYGFCESGCKVEVEPVGKVKQIAEGGTGETTLSGFQSRAMYAQYIDETTVDILTLPNGFYHVEGPVSKAANNFPYDSSEAKAEIIVFGNRNASNGYYYVMVLEAWSGTVYVRRRMWSTWSDWYKLHDSQKAIAVKDGGTGAANAATARANLGITPANIGAAPASHTHTKSQISDFPTSMPASDVYSWAKAASKPTYTASEVGAAASSHKHSASDITSGTLPPERGGTGVTSRNDINRIVRETSLNVLNEDVLSLANGLYHIEGSASMTNNWPVNGWVFGTVEVFGTRNAVGSDGYNNGYYHFRFTTNTGLVYTNHRQWDHFSGWKQQYTSEDVIPLKNLGFEVQCGVVNDVGTSGVQITFPEAFSGVPVVTATGGSENTSVYVRNITTTGFTLASGNSNNDGVQWQAIYISD